jgi:crotonobetainyl-CoA:carnitine CoA-transferase CaiB-like acyl-CoA transferase
VRLKNRDALNAAIDSYLADRTSADWIERLNAAGVPCGMINTVDKVFADPRLPTSASCRISTRGMRAGFCTWSASRVARSHAEPPRRTSPGAGSAHPGGLARVRLLRRRDRGLREHKVI